ncbi:MAG: glutaredoxin domain-containing protein, partial [Halomonas sp.]
METARVYRMKTAEHLCPFGMKTVDLLKRKGYQVDDHPLTSRDEIEAFKAQENVDTTPQTYIGDKRIGGYEEVREYLGMSVPSAKETSYRPVIAIFVTALLIGLAVSWVANGTLVAARMPEYAVATA